MMLGKRSAGRPSAAARQQQQQQQHMRRTTSLTEFAAPDVLADVAAEEEDEELQLLPAHAAAAGEAAAEAEMEDPYGWAIGGGGAATADWLAAYRASAAPALAGLRRNSADFSAAETAAFLRACGLCNRRLGPGRDTFMYRGDTAFCSLECRQQHMAIEEWKDKCALATPPTALASGPAVVPLPPPAGAGSDKPGTLAAAS